MVLIGDFYGLGLFFLNWLWLLFLGGRKHELEVSEFVESLIPDLKFLRVLAVKEVFVNNGVRTESFFLVSNFLYFDADCFLFSLYLVRLIIIIVVPAMVAEIGLH